MQDYIMVGIDVHEKKLVLALAAGTEEPRFMRFRNSPVGRIEMLRQFRKECVSQNGFQVFAAYEASEAGYGLYDQITDEGFECSVLAPTKIRRSVNELKKKTDKRDARQILDILRAHLLAGCDLPEVWVPDPQTRDDREIVRARLDAGQKVTALKAQIRSLLKRNGQVRPPDISANWTPSHRHWLEILAAGKGPLYEGGATALDSFLRQLQAFEQERDSLQGAVEALSRQERYREAVEALTELHGVGILTAMVFLTEMGDVTRFSNRRQVASYLGLVPSSHESGEANDRKGHITCHGPSRVRKVLCQASWCRTRVDPAYARIVEKNKRHKKIAIVALMRRLAIRMWHKAVDSMPDRAGPPEEAPPHPAAV